MHVGDPHNLLVKRDQGDPHPQYLRNNVTGRGAVVPLISGPTVFKDTAYFEKGFRFHTDNVVADDPLGDSFHHLNAAAANKVVRTWDASAGVTLLGGTGQEHPLISAPQEFNVYGSMSWKHVQLDPGDFTGGGSQPNGFYLNLVGTDLILLVNQTGVQISIAFLQPAQTIVTVKDITGASNPDIEIKTGGGKIDGPGSLAVPADIYTITNPYEHVVVYEYSSNTSIL